MEDQIAISLLKQGNLNGLEALVNRYQAKAVHAAYLITHDRAMAEDVAQAALVKAAERIQQFDENRAFPPGLETRATVGTETNAREHPESHSKSATRTTRRDRDALLPRDERSRHVRKNGAPAQFH